MTTENVQFTDATEKVVCSIFSGPQDPVLYPNQGQIDSSDARYAAFVEIFAKKPAPAAT